MKMIAGSLVAILTVTGFAVASGAPLSQRLAARYYISPVRVNNCGTGTSQVISSPFVRLIKANYVADGGAAVSSDGPETPPLPVIQAPGVVLPTIEEPLVALPSPPIPAPRVIASRCICTKTVIKPQIIQRQVTVPKVQRYLKRSYCPVVENIAYKARPLPATPNASNGMSTNKFIYNSGTCAGGCADGCAGGCYSTRVR